MSFLDDGVYHIMNVGVGLMLDLGGNRTEEGNGIQGFAPNGTTAQQVCATHPCALTGPYMHHW